MSIVDGMERLEADVFRVYPTKLTQTKYTSFFVRRRGGNLLFPCFGAHSSIEGSFAAIKRMGGVARQLLGDMHFAASCNDDVHRQFGAVAMCSDVEAADVRRKVRHVAEFPLHRHLLLPRVEVIPTPGHRPGAVAYLVTLGDRRLLFAGDSIWHDGSGWRCFAARKHHGVMRQTLSMLAELAFDVLYVNTRADNPVCSIALDADERRALCARIGDELE